MQNYVADCSGQKVCNHLEILFSLLKWCFKVYRWVIMVLLCRLLRVMDAGNYYYRIIGLNILDETGYIITTYREIDSFDILRLQEAVWVLPRHYWIRISGVGSEKL